MNEKCFYDRWSKTEHEDGTINFFFFKEDALVLKIWIYPNGSVHVRNFTGDVDTNVSIDLIDLGGDLNG